MVDHQHRTQQAGVKSSDEMFVDSALYNTTELKIALFFAHGGS